MLEYKDVSDTVNSLWNDFAEVRERAERRYDLYHLRKDPYVPEEIAREGKVRMLSSLVEHSANTIRADLLMNPTEFSVIPLARKRDGSVGGRAEDKAEALERALAIVWGRLNEGRHLDFDVIWHQLVSPYAVLQLEFVGKELPEQPEGMDDKAYNKLVEDYEAKFLPWKVTAPDPTTCAWLEREGEPTVFTRYYKVLTSDICFNYTQNKSSVEPDKHLYLEEGFFKWVTDDYARDHPRTVLSNFEECEVYYMDDGLYQYIAAKNPGRGGDETGVVLSCTLNPIGRPLAFIIPGSMTPEREPADRYSPYLLPLMQIVSQINDLRSMRATAARNLAGPHTYVTVDPEIQKLYLARGEKLPGEVKWKKNVTPYLLGDVKEVPSELSQDWDKIEERIYEEVQRYLPSPFVNVIDPAVLKSATATSILHAAEAGMRMYGPLMTAYDAAIRDICEIMILSLSLGYGDDDIQLYAEGDEMAGGKNVTAGSLENLNGKAVDFPHKVIVRTRSMSRAQASAQYEAVLNQWVLPDGSRGPATFDDLIDAANFTDKVAQKRKLAMEGILGGIDPWLQQSAMAKAHERIMIESGINIPLAGMAMPGMMPPGAPGDPSAQQPSGMPNNAQRMEAPMLAGPEGGSSPTGAM